MAWNAWQAMVHPDLIRGFPDSISLAFLCALTSVAEMSGSGAGSEAATKSLPSVPPRVSATMFGSLMVQTQVTSWRIGITYRTYRAK